MGKRQAARGPRSNKAEILTGVLTATRCDPQVKAPAPGFYTGSRPTDGRRLRQPTHTLPPRRPPRSTTPSPHAAANPSQPQPAPWPFPPARPSIQMSWLLSPASSPASTVRSPPRPLSGLACHGLNAPPKPVQQQIQPRQRVAEPKPPPYQLGDPGQRPVLILIPAPGGRAGIQHGLQLTQLRRAQMAPAGVPRPGRTSTAGTAVRRGGRLRAGRGCDALLGGGQRERGRRAKPKAGDLRAGLADHAGAGSDSKIPSARCRGSALAVTSTADITIVRAQRKWPANIPGRRA